MQQFQPHSLRFVFLWLIVLISSDCLQAQIGRQRPVYASRWGYLYETASPEAPVLGVFATEASLLLLDSTATHYRVQVSNDDIGYIKKQPLTTRMFGRTSGGEPSDYFYRGPEGQQGPHVYVQAAELRVRDRPSTAGKIVRRARLNEHISIDYYPLYDGAWIYVGDHFHEKPAYIPLQFVGEQLHYKDVLQDYLRVKNRDSVAEAKLVGRLRELAWWSGKPAELLEALQYYQESDYRLRFADPKVDIAFELRFAGKYQHYLSDFQQYAAAVQQLQMHYMFYHTRCEDGKISDKQARAIGLNRVEEIPDVPECGWYPQYFYTNDHIAIAFEESQEARIIGSVYGLTFAPDVALVLGDQQIDHTYSEEDFVDHFGHLLQADWIVQPHQYRIMNGDGGFFLLTFKNGFAVSFESIYYC